MTAPFWHYLILCRQKNTCYKEQIRYFKIMVSYERFRNFEWGFYRDIFIISTLRSRKLQNKPTHLCKDINFSLLKRTSTLKIALESPNCVLPQNFSSDSSLVMQKLFYTKFINTFIQHKLRSKPACPPFSAINARYTVKTIEPHYKLLDKENFWLPFSLKIIIMEYSLTSKWQTVQKMDISRYTWTKWISNKFLQNTPIISKDYNYNNYNLIIIIYGCCKLSFWKI